MKAAGLIIKVYVALLVFGVSFAPRLYADKKEEDKEEEFKWQPKEPKTFSASERKKECRKYEGKYLGYYGKIYLVENCLRREIVGKELVQKLFKKNISVVSVQADTIVKLKAGKSYTQLPKSLRKERSCRSLQGAYILRGGSDIYFIENCTKRSLPDFETYDAHRRERKKDAVLLELTDKEYGQLKKGEPIDSILPNVHKKLMEGWAPVDLLPRMEACKGVDNQYVTYYSKVYRIEKCFKREVKNISKFLKDHEKKVKRYVELSSQQWLSLPDGPVWDAYAKKGKHKKD